MAPLGCWSRIRVQQCRRLDRRKARLKGPSNFRAGGGGRLVLLEPCQAVGQSACLDQLANAGDEARPKGEDVRRHGVGAEGRESRDGRAKIRARAACGRPCKLLCCVLLHAQVRCTAMTAPAAARIDPGPTTATTHVQISDKGEGTYSKSCSTDCEPCHCEPHQMYGQAAASCCRRKKHPRNWDRNAAGSRNVTSRKALVRLKSQTNQVRTNSLSKARGLPPCGSKLRRRAQLACSLHSTGIQGPGRGTVWGTLPQPQFHCEF